MRLQYTLILYGGQFTSEDYGMEVAVNDAAFLPRIGEEVNHRGDLYEIKRIVHMVGTHYIRIYAQQLMG